MIAVAEVILEKSNKKRELAEKLLRQSTGIAGQTTSALAAAAVGGAVAGPIGIALGVLAGSVLSKSINELGDFAAQQLSKNERVRAGAAAAVALTEIKERLDNGESPRNDDFFELKDGQPRSSAEQIFEGVLLKAKNSHEDKKSIYYGKFYQNLVFDEKCSPSCANLMLNIGDKLTYRQFCFLALVSQAGLFNARRLRGEHSNLELEALKREEMDLHMSDLGIYGLLDEGSVKGQEDFGFIDKLSVLGEHFCELFALSDIPDRDLNNLKSLLRGAGCQI